jgi:hypothetical protein
MHGTTKREPLNGAILFDDVGDALRALGWNKPVSAQHQAERNAWQREASMSESERRAAYEARCKAKGIA